MSKTVDRIKKLLKLAACEGAGEHEADTARRLAEAMMAASGITLDDVVAAGGGTDPAATVAAQHGAKVRERWKGTVAIAVARIVGCVCYRDVNAGGRVVWLGTIDQREAAIALHAWVIAQINRMAKNVIYRLRERQDRRGYMNAYRLGVASAIATNALRLGAARKAHVDADTTALAARDRIADAIAKLTPELTHARSTSVRGDAFRVGQLDGSTVRFQADVGGGQQRLRLGGGS